MINRLHFLKFYVTASVLASAANVCVSCFSYSVAVSPALALVGNAVTLFCPYKVDPNCTFKWYKSAVGELDTTSSKYHLKASSTVLVIGTVGPDDAGNYTCAVIWARTGTIKNISNPGILKIFNQPQAAIFPEKGVFRLPVGETLKLQCIGSSDALFVLWSYNGQQLSDSSRRQIAMSSLTNSTLTILRAEQRDAGTYTCEAFVQKGQAAKNVTVVIEYPPSSVTVRANKREYLLGESLVLFCFSDSEPLGKFSWKHNGSVIPEASSSAYAIIQAKYVDSGVYSCTVENYLGSANDSATIRILPVISVMFEPVKKVAILGEELILNCSTGSFTSFSSASFEEQWFKYSSSYGRKLINNDQSYLIHQNGSLYIRKVAKRDNATFQCRMKPNGIFLQKYILKVVYWPTKVRQLAIKRIHFKSYNLSWLPPADGGNCFLEGYTVQYQSRSYETVNPWWTFQLGSGQHQIGVLATNENKLNSNVEELSVTLFSSMFTGYLLVTAIECREIPVFTRDSFAASLSKVASSVCICSTNVSIEVLEMCGSGTVLVKVSAEFSLNKLFKRGTQITLGNSIVCDVSLESEAKSCSSLSYVHRKCEAERTPLQQDTWVVMTVIIVIMTIIILLAVFLKRRSKRSESRSVNNNSETDSKTNVTDSCDTAGKATCSTLV